MTSTRNISFESPMFLVLAGGITGFVSSLVLTWMQGTIPFTTVLATIVVIAVITVAAWLALYRDRPGSLVPVVIALVVGAGLGYGAGQIPIGGTQPNGLRPQSVLPPPPDGCPRVDSLALNARLTTYAWCEFNQRRDSSAIALADECVATFQAQAVRAQEAFTARGEPHPPVGRVPAEEAARIHARGLLNDVATCHYIRAMSLQRLGRTADAREAYQAVLRFPDARTWDETGGFWPPAEAAESRLARLR